MEIIQLDKARGAQIRAMIKWTEEGERHTTYFAAQRKAEGKKVMTKLRRTTGETTTNQTEILQEQVTYYKNLYNQSPNVDDIGKATSRFVLNEDMQRLVKERLL